MEKKDTEVLEQLQNSDVDRKTDILPIGGTIKYDDGIVHELGAKYSVLICGKRLVEFADRIQRWLEYGIKVLWFGDAESCKQLKSKFGVYADEYLLQIHECDPNIRGIAVDGCDDSGLVDKLESACPFFNAAQYRVEHCKADEHVVVQASAGTGKTTVMIDRIMFLMHTVPGIHMYDIYMITFTNDATEEMNRRLQKTLLTRYHLTGNIKYFRWVEEQSQMQISTIHSFCYLMLRTNGFNMGFSEKLAIKGLANEKHKIISDVIDRRTSEAATIDEVVGEKLYQTKTLIEKYWDTFAKIGVSHKDIHNMQWGENFRNDEARKFNDFIKEVIPEVDDEFFELKRKRDEISLNDIIRDLQVVLEDYVRKVTESELDGESTDNLRLDMKYLFIDEFQDTDLSQIDVAMLLVRLTRARLFVVGDVKQSIYAFRGANDEAFNIFSDKLRLINNEDHKDFSLKNNYRTSKVLMDSMDEYFKKWGKADLLKYDNPVVPLKDGLGEKTVIYKCSKPKSLSSIIYEENEEDTQVIESMKGKSNNDDQSQPSGEEIASVTKKSLEDLIKRVEEAEKKPDEKDRVVLLTRTNSQLDELSMLLRKNKIPCMVKREGSFYTSEAVRDFFSLICSYVFESEPKYVFNYLMTPFSGFLGTIDLKELEKQNGDKSKIFGCLKKYLDGTPWEKYHKDLRLKPVISVIKCILEDKTMQMERIKKGDTDFSFLRENLENEETKKKFKMENLLETDYIYTYIKTLKRTAREEGWDEKTSKAIISIRATQYKADIYKLVRILFDNFGMTKTSLYDVYRFLKIQIATNREEEEPSIRTQDDYRSVLCMTAHKSKGLEFDTIIIPYTTKRFRTKKDKEIIIEPTDNRVGWNGEGKDFCNEFYEELHEAQVLKEKREETRILYVAMTRAINRLVIIIPMKPKDDTWASCIGY
ncbi:UvrD-helicase domain-containing protein [Butyrivibrio sp. NC2002]|uniref:UvrD-helicase domain-containing protein n=1 Tax=Butyrivibrio sp. NC2002 TaxID=1410610 RepID=UPI00055A380D|nr:UvrD-helicase domain-containing protein [Butyrivibrio sp. NC2002]